MFRVLSVFIGKKKTSTCEWTRTVQTSVVQELAVLVGQVMAHKLGKELPNQKSLRMGNRGLRALDRTQGI